jgi:hypothetical protein
MTASRDPERMIHAFLLEGAERMHDQVYDAIRAEVDLRPQRAVIGPWRVPALNKLLPIGLGAAAVIAAVFLGTRLLGSPSGPGASALPTATLEATATPEPSPTPAAPTLTPLAAPPLTQSFTSTKNGISLSVPDGWLVRAASEPWTGSTYALVFDPPTPYIDYLYDPVLADHLFLNLASQPIGAATPEQWIAAQMAGDEGCATTEPVAVDGATGLIGAEGCELVAAVTVGGRGYVIRLHASQDNPSAVAPYDQTWFEQVLATVQLHPEDDVD